MRWLFYLVLFAIASRFFAGLRGGVSIRSDKPAARRMRRFLLATSFNGLVLGVMATWLVYTYGGHRSRIVFVILYMAWLLAEVILTATEWDFVWHATRREKDEPRDEKV